MLTYGVMVAHPGRPPCRAEHSTVPCPLFSRGARGDRGVPCVEAQAEADVSPADHRDASRFAIPTGDGPGESADPVRLLHIRPCFLLGCVAAIGTELGAKGRGDRGGTGRDR